MKISQVLLAAAGAVAVLALAVVVSIGAPPAATVRAQGANLLFNPGMEGTYVTVGIYENMRVAAGWIAWWREGSWEEILEGYRLRPEYKASFADEVSGDRVHSGWQAQQYFHSYATIQGGIFQIVNNVKPGQRLRFSIWGMAWSCEDWYRCHEKNPPRVWSWRPSPMHMRIGIDPFGGNDAFSTNIVWSSEFDSYDTWSQWTVEAVAASSTVTVWTYAYPDYRSQDNDIYLDDAELTVVGTGTAPTGGTPVPTAVPGGSGTSSGGTAGAGEQTYTVVAGDTLSALGLRFGVSWQAIAQRNELTNPDYIYIGQVLIIPAP
jgi:hypothetical protein